MLPIPANALAGLAYASPVNARAEYSLDGKTWEPLQLVSGSVTADRTADTRYTARADLLDAPTGRYGLDSLTCLVRLWRGLQLPRTAPWWCPAGLYAVSKRTTVARTTSLELDGLESLIRDQNLPVPLVVGPGAVLPVITDLVHQVVNIPVQVVGLDSNDGVDRVIVDSSRWDVLSNGQTSTGDTIGIASALGGECFVNAGGVFILTETPRLGDAPVWTMTRESVLVAEPSTEFTTDGVYNVVAATGDKGDGSPVVGPAFAWDTDPASSTYAGPNPIGDPAGAVAAGARLKVLLYSSPLLTTLARAQKAAASQLANSLGASSSLSLSTVSNLALEPGDVVEVETAPGVFERHLIDSMSGDLAGVTIDCTTRATVARIG